MAVVLTMKPLELQSGRGVDDEALELQSSCVVDSEVTRVAKWLWC